MNHPVIVGQEIYDQIYDQALARRENLQDDNLLERLQQEIYDQYDQTESYQKYVNGVAARVKERERISSGLLAKKKSRFSWRRTLLFIIIYFVYTMFGLSIQKYSPFVHYFLFCFATYAGINWVGGIKRWEHFWEEKE